MKYIYIGPVQRCCRRREYDGDLHGCDTGDALVSILMPSQRDKLRRTGMTRTSEPRTGMTVVLLVSVFFVKISERSSEGRRVNY